MLACMGCWQRIAMNRIWNAWNRGGVMKTKNGNVFAIDMTQGNEMSVLIRFAFPLFIGNLVQQLYGMADSIIVGRYINATALGAIGSVGSITFLFFSLCNGLSAGIGVLISQYRGAGETEFVKKIIGNALYITAIIGTLISVLAFAFTTPILKLIKVPEDNFAYAETYMYIVCGATIVVAVYNAVAAVMRSLGDSITPLICLVISAILNVGLDLLFVITFDWGVAGAAWATVISQALSAVSALGIGILKNDLMKLSKKHFVIDRSIIKEVFRLGIPMAIQNALVSFSMVCLQVVINSYGTVAMAANTAVSRVEQFINQPFSALSTALATFTGQNMGADRLDRVKKGMRKCLISVVVFTVSMIGVMFMFGEPIISLFVEEREIIEVGAKGLQILSFAYIGLGLIYILRAVLNGAGDTGFIMYNGIIEVVGRIGFAMLFVQIPSVGIWGIWYTTGLTWLLTGLMNVFRVASGKWKDKVVVKKS